MEIDEIDTIAVLGAGTMGHGIAEVSALAGYETRLRDINQDIVQDGYERIETSLNKLEAAGSITDSEADAALDRVSAVVELEQAIENADVVIEAVPERMDIKKEVYGDAIEYATEDAIFASNTSSLSISDLGMTTDRPERFCGMHFFNPPVYMDLVEVVGGKQTSEEVLRLIEDLARSMDKTPIRVHKDEPGFIVNRILLPTINEASWILTNEDGSIETVDATAKHDLGLPMGLFELADEIGIDVCYEVLEYMHDELGDAYEPSPILREKVDTERLGKKTGQGFYDHDQADIEPPEDASSKSIRDRLLAVMANESAKLIANEVATQSTIDQAMKLGAGFPEGPTQLADDVGIETLVETLDDLNEKHSGGRYESSQLLRELATMDGGFHSAELPSL